MPSSTQVGFWPVGCARPSSNLWLLPALLGALVAPVSAEPAESESKIRVLKQLSIDELMELEVTSVTKSPQKLSEAPSAIQVVTNEDVRRSGATSLPEALRLASNLHVAQINSQQWAISARGFNSSSANKLLVLMDGRTLYSPLHAAVFWDVQDTILEDLDRIEVISGPGATQWGANAVNGVINIITKGAKDTQGLLITAGGGTALNGFAGVRYGGRVAPGLYYRVYGKHSDRDRTKFSDGRTGANDWRMNQGGFRVDWTLSADDLLTLQGDVYGGTLGQPANDDVRVKGGNWLGRWSRTFSEKSNITLQWYYDSTYRRIPGTFAEDLETWDVNLQHRFPLGTRHDVIWGVGYRLVDDQQHNDYPLLAFLPGHVIREDFSLFTQDEITLLPEQLKLTAGAKLEHNEYTGFEFQPSLRVAWSINQQQTIWAAVSRAMRAPSRIDGEFFSPRDPPFTVLQGNPDFLSEELLAYELGYRLQTQHRLSFALALFYHDYDRLRSIERVNPAAPFPIFLGNGIEGTSTGGELTADYQPFAGWRLRGGYTQLHLELRTKPGSTSAIPASTDPEHQFFLRSALDLPRQMELDVTYRFVSRLSGTRVPAYDELDVRLGWQPLPSVEMSVVGQNLLQAHHAEFNAAASRQQIARSFYGKIVWNF
jgi:iron complex outermembrane receptor protein